MKALVIILGLGLFSLALFKAQIFKSKTDIHPSKDEISSTSTAGSLPALTTKHYFPQKTKSVNQQEIKAIEDLNIEEIRLAISEIETEFLVNDSLARLNAEAVDPFEREELGEKLRKLDSLRVQELELELQTLQQDLKKIEENHASRLETYIVEPS